MAKFELLPSTSKFAEPYETYTDIVEADAATENYFPSFKAAYLSISWAINYMATSDYKEGFDEKHSRNTEEAIKECTEWTDKAFYIASANILAIRAYFILGYYSSLNNYPSLCNYHQGKVKLVVDRVVCLAENSLLIQEAFSSRIALNKPIKAGKAESILTDIYKELNIPYPAKIKYLSELFYVSSKNVRDESGVPVKHYVFSKFSEDGKAWFDMMLFEYYGVCELNVKIPKGYTIKTSTEYQKEQQNKYIRIVETIEETDFNCHVYKITIHTIEDVFYNTFYITVDGKIGLPEEVIAQLIRDRFDSKNLKYLDFKCYYDKIKDKIR